MIIEIKDNFNLKKITDSGQCFRAKKLEDGIFRFINNNQILYIKQISPNKYICNWNSNWNEYFNLNKCYKNIIPKDKFMKEAYQYANGIRILKQDPWETLISFIISQRKSIPAIKTSVERLCENFGTKISNTEIAKIFTDLNSKIAPEKNLYAFPSPKQLAQADIGTLKKCGLGYRLDYILETAKLVYSGDFNLKPLNNLSTPLLLDKLQTLKGVGTKVANCVALFAYGRHECAPVDIWINKIIQMHYNGKNPFPSFGKNAGILQQYTFYYVINNNISI